jgi:biotin transport system substrate-specific component
MAKHNPLSVYRLTLGALYIALFALASNIPVLSAINIIPGVPITLQVFLIAMMGLTLGVRGGVVTYCALLVLTFCGLPLMSGGKGGPAVFVGPTSGYIYGWIFIIIIYGLYSLLLMEKLVNKKLFGFSLHLPVCFLLGIAGILIDYICGSIGLVLYGSSKAFPALFISNLAFLPADAIKIALASVISLMLAKPAIRRLLHIER